VAALSAGAGLVHAAVAPEHFREHVAYGVFFVAVAVAQLAWPRWVVRSGTRKVLAAGLIGNLGIIAVWVVSRTSGLPVGPEAFEREAIGAADGLATAFEAGIVTGCALLLRGGRRRARRAS
jgi:MFS family permease